MLKEKYQELINLLVKEIKSFYQERLISIVLFGSVARETQRFDSDIDLLIVVKDLPKGRLKRTTEFMEIEEKIEEYLKSLEKIGINTYISPVLKTPEEVKMGSPLFLDLVEEAQILYDKEDFFKKELEKLKEKLKSLGAKRYWLGNAWYWVLKPDIKPGETIKL
ncbi:MAG: nucleotidyltransferase domain-containing protein [Thermodesulfobacteriaceae bacterium]|nr:nucleotidyltransferase domain-containing protein [Thermodesulfobacteriaceae bacterium]MCX8042443.1 nucleotidyltransferase domain-containing protein [Thermodesulfobacteriaceae bacterium]MDW8136622.1 nucleotidyltransferase domain-containing protein [Thermodesulfobacterium sp.]